MVKRNQAKPDRAALRERYLTLRGASKDFAGMTLRAGRFAAARQTCAIDFAMLARMPDWEFADALDRARFAEIIGLVAARDHLARALDGATLRKLAEHFGSDLIDRVLDDADGALETVVALPSFAIADLRQVGSDLMMAAQTDWQEARTICELAWDYYRREHSEA
ncbi:MAG: hypothetical protein AAF494_10780 [Pseudomonadota bacterium]